MLKAVKESEVNPEIPAIIGKDRWYIFCPGCYLDRKEKHPDDPRTWMNGALHCFSENIHRFNGDVESPTLYPSLLNSYHYGEDRKAYICHSFVTDGRIQFLSDCTHPLANQTVELMDVQPYLDYVKNNIL
jgi:hypothetical protein